MSQITDQIWVGSYGNASDTIFLQDNQLTHIITCAIELATAPSDVPGFNRFRVDIIDDIVTPDTIVLFLEAASRLDFWVSQGHRVLVHCFAGMSRSVSVVIAYLMLYRKMSYKDAFKLVKDKRRQANPHPGFIPLLLDIERHAGFPNDINAL